MPAGALRRVEFTSFGVTLWAGVMLLALRLPWPAPYNYPPRFPVPVSSPILAVELAQTPADFAAVLRRDSSPAAAAAVRVNTYLDLAFIPLYVLYLVFLSRSLLFVHRRTAQVAVILACAAGVADYVEDALIFAALHGVPGVHWAALAKWTLLAFCFAALGSLLVRSNGVLFSLTTDRMLGVGHLWSAAMMLSGIVFGRAHYDLLESGTRLFASLVCVFWAAGVLEWLAHHFPGTPPSPVENFCANRPIRPRRGLARLL